MNTQIEITPEMILRASAAIQAMGGIDFNPHFSDVVLYLPAAERILKAALVLPEGEPENSQAPKQD
jgi:hypothetical protein